MNAAPLSDAIQPGAPAAAPAANSRTASQDFACALSDAGGKPGRKNVSNKHPDPTVSGGPMPAPGNQPPLASTAPPPAKTDAPAAVGGGAAGSVNGPTGGAQSPLPSAGAAAPTSPADASSAATILTPESFDAALPLAAAAVPASATPPAPAVGVDATTSSASPTVPGSGMTMPHAPSVRTLAAPGTATAPSVAAAPTVKTRAAISRDSTAYPATSAAANSARSSADANATLDDSTVSGGPAAATGTDAAAQAVMAAAISQGASVPAPDASSSDDSPIADNGVAPGAATPSDPAAATPATVLARASAASISAAVTAATAASVTQALSAVASTGTADKRSHANSPDATLSGASNDGSVGAAQLLTSNAPADSVPAPTFRVAAGVDTAQFGQGVADHVSLMMDGNLTSAKLQVNPPALGPIEVRIALQGGHAQVSFSSHSAVTRDALESSSEKLREMLGSQGFSQVSVDISQRSFQERPPPSQAYESAPSISGDAPVLAQVQSVPRNASGVLDAYA